MCWLLSAASGAILLLSLPSIPIAFDVGGRDAGLAYSLSLFLFYVFFSSFKLLTPDTSRVRLSIANLIRLSQCIILPALLIWSLNRFSVDAESPEWVSHTLSHMKPSLPTSSSWSEWFFGRGGVVEDFALGGWDKALRYSSPVFQLLEGFCTLLVVQAAGQITRWLVNRGRSDTWVIILLVLSGSIMASASYFLWRVAHFPQISNADAILIGVTMTSAVFLGCLGIGSGRGNPLESSLLFAYVVLCVYQIFTDYLPSDPDAAATAEQVDTSQPEFPPLPPAIMASFSTLIHMIRLLPDTVSSSLQLLYAAFQTVTPSVLISLAYRIVVFYCATRIIPSVRESGARTLMDEPSLEDSDAASKFLGFLSWYSTSIFIAIYTSLLLQHFSVNRDGDDIGWTLRGADADGNTWRWINVAGTLGLYAIELYLSADGDQSLTGHWKTD